MQTPSDRFIRSLAPSSFAFLLGTNQIIELLISEAYDHINDPQVLPHTFCLEARELIDDTDYDKLAEAVEAKSSEFSRCSWASSAEARQAAKALAAVAVKCTRGVTGRSTPEEVLSELERLARGALRTS